MKINFVTLVLIAVTAMSCNTGKKSNTGSDAAAETNNEMAAIENTKWVITTLEGKDVAGRKNDGEPIYFTLNSEDHRVNGFSGCNTFMGTYKIEDGNRISFSQMAMTRMACPEGDIKESEIISIFENADNFTISDGKLALNKARRAPLAEFKEAEEDTAPIVGKYWKLKTLEGQDVEMAENQEREIYFTLNSEDQRVNGFAGCNTVSGSYTLEEGNRIRFSNMLTTLKACPDVNVNESEFLKIFELADNYTIVDDVLSLNVGRRAPLAVFEAVYFD